MLRSRVIGPPLLAIVSWNGTRLFGILSQRGRRAGYAAAILGSLRTRFAAGGGFAAVFGNSFDNDEQVGYVTHFRGRGADGGKCFSPSRVCGIELRAVNPKACVL